MRVGQSRRRDQNEKAIRKALEAAGCETWPISGVGAPDLLIRRGPQLWAVEVKTASGTRTKAQERSQWPIIRDITEALDLVFGGERR